MFGSTNSFGQSSSSPFASQPVFGQTSNTSNNPFVPKPFGSTIPFGAQTGSSIFGGTSTGVFGAAQSSSPFSSSTTFSASSSPAFGNTTPAFGAASSPAFNSSPSPFGGSSGFGQKPVFEAFGSNTAQPSPFGSTTQPSQPAFGSGIFGSTTPFGGSSQPAFGATTTPAFGGTSSPAFGATSTPAFGATSTPAFGATSTPAFGATSTPAFGATSNPPAFGATSSPAFGSTTSPTFGSTGSAFGVSNSSVFGSTGAFGASSTPAFGSSGSTFGTSSNPGFGASSAHGFGSSSTPSFSFTSAPAFGQSNSTFSSASSPFGAQSSPFGSPAFGSTTSPTFGSTGSAFGVSNSSVFGSTGAFGASSTPAFGSSGSTFGTSSNPGFGALSALGFGSSSTPSFSFTSAPAFGQSNSTFGSASSPFGAQSSPFGAQPTTLGSNAFGQSAFGGQQRRGSRVAAYTETPEPDGGSGATAAKLESISAMPVYKDKSHEELRWEDYQLGDKGGPAPAGGSGFGMSASQPNSLNTASSFPQASTSPFNTATAPNLFSPKIPSFPSTGFGTSSTAFSSSSFGSSFSFTSAPAFGQSNSTFGSASSPFGAQSTPFGAQPTPLGNNTFGQSAFWGQQRGGSRVAAYTETPEPDGGSGATAAKLESISAMPVYKDKSHEELRWEDYQLGDKGGPAPAGGSGFGMSAAQPNSLNTASSFPQASTSPFNTATAPNLFTPKTPSFPSTGFGTSSTPFSSSSFGLSTSTNIFTPSSSPSGFGQTSSPSLFTSSAPSTFSFSAPAQTSNSTFNTGIFNSTAPVAQTGSTFGLSTTSFGQNTTPFGQSNAFNTPSTGYGLGSSSTASATSNLMGFSQPTPSFPTPFQPSQPPQNSGFGFNSFSQIQPGNTGGLGGSAGILGQNNFGQLSATQSSAAVQPVPATNPFGTLPAMPQMSIGRGGTAPSIQYGISSMPVVDKLAPARMSSSLVTSRHLTQRRVRLPVRKYYPKNDDQRFPFFIDDEETVNTPKADALFLPRENPRALVIRPKEQWPRRASAEKASPLKDTSTPVHENEIPHEDGIVKERVNHVKANQKPNGVHDDHSIQKGDSYMTLSGHRAGEAAIVYEHGADIEALMPKLRRSDYYTEPRIQELAAKERAEPGFCCHVKDFVVGRVDYGSIKFFGETDVRRLDLESVVQFNNREVIVYMDDNKKPPVGQGLNKPAEVTLLNITCMDKKTGRRFTEGPKTEKYKQMLKKKAEDQGAEFVSYDPLKGEWKFKVSHFSEYKLGDEDDWDVNGAQDC